uniref:Uncharacterized protein n=1 Tax=Plectus sambesii TaxID=2011161 RepID=A0A914V0U8_9BILA
MNRDQHSNRKEKKLFGVELGPVLTVADLSLKSADYMVVANLAIENYTNEKLKLVKVDIIRGELPNEPRDIAPGEKLQFCSRKGSWTLYGVCALAIWQYKDRLIVVMWKVPLTIKGGYNNLGVGITNPGVKHSEITIKPGISFDNHYKLIQSTLGSSDCNYKAFQYRDYNASIQDISVEDRDITISGRMGILKNCEVGIEIIPHREDDFAPHLINYAEEHAKKMTK